MIQYSRTKILSQKGVIVQQDVRRLNIGVSTLQVHNLRQFTWLFLLQLKTYCVKLTFNNHCISGFVAEAKKLPKSVV